MRIRAIRMTMQNEKAAADRLIVISGCSGGGKTTLIEEIERRGRAIVEEPGRRIVTEERVLGGRALPWLDPGAFARRAVALARADRAWATGVSGLVFFDRGLVDAAAALEHATGEPAILGIAGERYHRRVFLVPPWPEIYVWDADRQHGFEEAIAEYDRLLAAFDQLGYAIELLPKSDPSERANIVFEVLRQR